MGWTAQSTTICGLGCAAYLEKSLSCRVLAVSWEDFQNSLSREMDAAEAKKRKITFSKGEGTANKALQAAGWKLDDTEDSQVLIPPSPDVEEDVEQSEGENEGQGGTSESQVEESPENNSVYSFCIRCGYCYSSICMRSTKIVPLLAVDWAGQRHGNTPPQYSGKSINIEHLT